MYQNSYLILLVSQIWTKKLSSGWNFLCQYIDAISPSNFALTNPEVVKTMIDTHGKSLADGMHMMMTLQNGYITMTDNPV